MGFDIISLVLFGSGAIFIVAGVVFFLLVVLEAILGAKKDFYDKL